MPKVSYYVIAITTFVCFAVLKVDSRTFTLISTPALIYLFFLRQSYCVAQAGLELGDCPALSSHNAEIIDLCHNAHFTTMDFKMLPNVTFPVLPFQLLSSWEVLSTWSVFQEPVQMPLMLPGF